MANNRIPGFKTVEEAAENLGISPGLVSTYCKTKKLRARRVGKMWFISDDDLAAFSKEPRPVGNPNFLRRKAIAKKGN